MWIDYNQIMVFVSQWRSFTNWSHQQKIYKLQMMANYERLTQLLEKMQHSEYIRMVESELKTLSEDPLIVSILVMAVGDQRLTHNTKLAAAVTLNRTITDHYHDFEEPMMIEEMVRLYFDFTVDFKYKHAIQNAFVSLLELAESSTVQDIFKMITWVTNSINSSALEGHSENSMVEATSNPAAQLQKVQIIYYIYKCVLDACNHIYRLYEQIQSTLGHFLTLVPVSSNPDCVATLYRMADFLASFMEKINESSLEALNEYADQFCTSQPIYQWIIKIYQIRGIKGNCWISLDHEPQPTQLNDLKTRAAELHHNLILHMNREEGTFEDYSAVLKKHCQISRQLINTLSVYGKCGVELGAYQGFVTALVKCLIILYHQNREFFSNIFTNLFHEVVFPLLSIKQEEMITFDQDPQEFNRLAEDCCDHQRFGILKTDVAMLLQTICDENEAAATYLIQHCIISLKVRLALDQNFQVQAPNFLSIETAILAMSIQSYKLGKFQRELLELKSIFKFQQTYSRLSNLQLSRLFAFFAYNYSEIYRNPLEGEEWINLALNADKHPTVEIAALDFITNVVEDYFNIDFLRNFATKTLYKGSLHITAFIKMLTCHMQKINEADMVDMADILLRLMAREIDMYDSRDKAHTIDLVASMHMIKKFLEKDYCIDKPILKQKLWQVIDLMPHFKKLHLDDELIRIIVCFINKESTLNSQILATIEPVIMLYKMDRLDCTAFLVYFNIIIMRGHNSIAVHLANLLIEAFLNLKAYGIHDNRMTRMKVGVGSICIVFQNMLAIHGKDVPSALIDQFSALALLIIPEADNPQDKLDTILVARALNLLFLCHMVKKNDIALRRILIFQDSTIFHSYDLRVLCVCLCKEILQEKDIIAVTQMINIMVKAISAAKEDGVTIKAKRNPLSIKPSATKIRIKRVEDYEHVLKFMTTPFPKDSLPEAELQKVIQTMKNYNPHLYQAIIKSLTRPVYDKLKHLMTEVVIGGRKRQIVHVGNLKENGKIPTSDAMMTKGIKKRQHAQSEEEYDDLDEHTEYFDSKRRNTHKKRLKHAKDHQ